MLITEFADFLYHRVCDSERLAMGCTRPPPRLVDAHDSHEIKRRVALDTNSAETQFRGRLRAMLARIDSSPHRPRQQLDWEIFDAGENSTTPQQIECRRRLLGWVCNRLLEATWLTLPKQVRRSWNSSLALDATFVGTLWPERWTVWCMRHRPPWALRARRGSRTLARAALCSSERSGHSVGVHFAAMPSTEEENTSAASSRR